MENIDNIINGELALNVRIKINAVIDKVNNLSITVPEIIAELNEIKEDIILINQNLGIFGDNLTTINDSINSLNNLINSLDLDPETILNLQEEINVVKSVLDNGNLGSLTLTNDSIVFNPFIGDEIFFIKEDNGDQIDYIDEDNDIAITRDTQNGIYNPLLEQEWNFDESPKGTLWNADGYNDFKDVPFRIYTNFRDVLKNEIGKYVLNTDLVMYVPSINKYFKVKFTSWTSGSNGGGFSYTRQEINTSFYFNRLDNEYLVDVIDTNIQIARNTAGGWLFNPIYENTSSQNTPTGTLWNNEGWNDLSDLLNRNFKSLATLYQNNFRRIVGDELVMKDTINNKYYLFKFNYWSVGNGGGFSYTRFLLNLDKLKEGVKFSDGTIQKTAITPTKSRAFGTWKIIENYKNNSINLTPFIVEEEFTGVTLSNPFENQRLNDLFVDGDLYPLIVASINEGNQYWRLVVNNQFYFVYAYIDNIDNTNYIVFNNESNLPFDYNEGDSFTIKRGEGGEPVKWFVDNNDDFRGASIEYHAYLDRTNFSGGGTFIGNILISKDGGNDTIAHNESFSGSNNTGDNAVIWYRNATNGRENEVYFYMKNGDEARLRIHYTYKGFYGTDYYD